MKCMMLSFNSIQLKQATPLLKWRAMPRLRPKKFNEMLRDVVGLVDEDRGGGTYEKVARLIGITGDWRTLSNATSPKSPALGFRPVRKLAEVAELDDEDTYEFFFAWMVSRVERKRNARAAQTEEGRLPEVAVPLFDAAKDFHARLPKKHRVNFRKAIVKAYLDWLQNGSGAVDGD